MAAWCGSLALVALTVIITCAGALPLNAQATTRGSRPDDSRVTINKYTNQPNTGNGEYRYEFELSDGTRRFEEGSLTGPGGSLLVHGSFSRPAFDGTMEQVMYYADEEGFHLARMLPPLLGGPSASLIASLVG